MPTVARIGPYRFFFFGNDGLAAPLAWFPRLLRATPEQRRHFEILGDGAGIHWPDVDEDLSVAGLLRGTPSAAR